MRFTTLATVFLVACSGPNRRAGEDAAVPDGAVDVGPDGDADDVTSDADADPPWVPPDGGALTPEEVPNCGDGVLDPGEQCDDHNRLNGDGCDWLCRLGNGEPPPEPDPTVSDYAPSGDPVPADDVVGVVRTAIQLPLSWSGTQFATAHLSSPDDNLRFHRFDASGRELDSDWTYPLGGSEDKTWDLVWTGREYGLFCVIWREGVYFLRLDETGKPLGNLVLLDSDHDGYYVAADTAPGGYVVTWSHCAPDDWAVRVLLLAPDGSIDGFPESLTLPVTICAQGDIASGPGGFGVSMAPTHGTAQLVRVSDDLADVVTSGRLGEGWPGDVVWTGDRYVTAMDWRRDGDRPHLGTCVASFSSTGVLEAPPYCSRALESTDVAIGARLAVGDGGLALVYRASRAQRLLFLRTDMFGVPVGPPHDLFDPSEDPIPMTFVDGAAVTWADDAFAVLFSRAGSTLMLTRVVRAEP